MKNSGAIVTLIFFHILGLSRTTLACDQKAADSGKASDLIECAMEPYDDADLELNQYYKRISDSLKSEKKDKQLISLRAEQRSWIKKKEKACKMYFDEAESGREGPIQGYGCYLEKTEKRLAELKKKFTSLTAAAGAK